MVKKNLKIGIITMLLIILTATTVFASSEITTTSGDNNTVNTEDNNNTVNTGETAVDTSDWVNSDLYACSENIYVNKIIDGNAYIVAQTVEIDSEIAGSVFILANEVKINDSAVVYGSIYVCAKKLTYEGACYDIYGAVQECNFTENAYIDRDIKIVADKLSLNGMIRRNADVTAQTIEFATTDTTVISGNFNYTTNSEMQIAEGVVGGTATFNKMDTQETKTVSSIILDYISNLATALVYALIVALIIIFIAPKFLEKASKTNVQKGFVSLGVGILGAIIAIVAPFFLLFTVVGVKTAFVTWGIFAILCTVSIPLVEVIIAKIVNNKLKWEGRGKLILTTLAVAAIVWLISLVPILGFIVKLLLGLLGFGIVLVSLKPEKQVKETKQVEDVK